MAELDSLLTTKGFTAGLTNQFTNIIAAPDLTKGVQTWADGSGGGLPTFDATGVFWTVDDGSDLLRIYSPFGPQVAAGQYVVYADITVAVTDLAINNAATVIFNPLINGSGLTLPSRLLPVGKTTRVAMLFTVAVPVDNFGIYFNAGGLTGYKTADNQNASSPRLRVTARAFQIDRLGTDAQALLTELGETAFADTMKGLGAPYYPQPKPIFVNALYASKSTKAVTAETADHATTAGTATVANSVASLWSGLKGGVFGDSLVFDNSWQPHVAAALGVTFDNAGLGGEPVSQHTSVATSGGYLKARTAELDADCKFLIYLHGANDAITGNNWLNDNAGTLPIGVFTDAPLTDAQLTAGTLPTTFAQAYNTMLLNGYKRFPRIPKFICTQFRYFGSYNTGGAPQLNPNAAIKVDMIRQIADYWGIPLIDLWKESQINFWTKNSYLLNEDVGKLWIHPNAAGGKRVAEVIIGRMRDLDPQTFVPTNFGTDTVFA